LLLLDDAEIETRCTEWSVPRSSSPIFSRGDAILAWQVRQQLSPGGQTRFDALSVPARRQLADLHHLVLTAPSPVNEPAEILFRN
jgi:hypothetical protein